MLKNPSKYPRILPQVVQNRTDTTDAQLKSTNSDFYQMGYLL